MTGYKRKDGVILFVSPGIGGDTFATYTRVSVWSKRRYFSRLLPIRATRDQAEYDLRKYALITKLKKVDLPEDYAK
jgi:hypothetical protein